MTMADRLIAAAIKAADDDGRWVGQTTARLMARAVMDELISVYGDQPCDTPDPGPFFDFMREVVEELS